jgi:hypothetical protein
MNIQVRASTALLGYGRRSGTHDLWLWGGRGGGEGARELGFLPANRPGQPLYVRKIIWALHWEHDGKTFRYATKNPLKALRLRAFFHSACRRSMPNTSEQ